MFAKEIKTNGLFIMRALVVCTIVLPFFSCSSLEPYFGENKKHREFTVRKLWVRQGTQKENPGFRKINRMTPWILGKDLLQANAIDGLVSYDLESGQEKWRLKVDNGIEGGGALIKETLFVGGLNGQFYSVNAKTGTINWTFPMKSEFLSEPLLVEGVVYVLSGSNVLYALDGATGKQLWMYSRQDTSSLSIRGGSKPAYNKGNIFVGFSDGAMVSFNSKSGAVNWELQLNKGKRFRDIDASPVVDDDLIYISSYDDKLYCIHSDRGEVQWKIEGGGFSAVTILGDKLFFPTTNGEILALKKTSGEKVWTFKTNHGIASQIKTLKGFLVFGESQGSLVFLNPENGTVKKEFEPGRGILSSPLVDEKSSRVYFISGEANVYALEAKWDWPNWFSFVSAN